jgi:deoxyribose-phosphate aldolase
VGIGSRNKQKPPTRQEKAGEKMQPGGYRIKKEEKKTMDIKEILAKVDHTVLGQTATWADIKGLCDDGMKYETASVCIPPSYVKQAAEYINSVNGKLKVCTVIGFPNGYNTTAVKCYETRTAVEEGADEIDMVINIGWVKDGLYDKVLDEIKQIKAACSGKLLKVIIETCLLTDEEKIKLCKVVSESGADYIKTSTGFSKAGATFEDVKLMADNVDGILVKAAGGISSIADAEKFIELGASRLGTSRIVKLVKAEKAEENTY